MPSSRGCCFSSATRGFPQGEYLVKLCYVMHTQALTLSTGLDVGSFGGFLYVGLRHSGPTFGENFPRGVYVMMPPNFPPYCTTPALAH